MNNVYTRKCTAKRSCFPCLFVLFCGGFPGDDPIVLNDLRAAFAFLTVLPTGWPDSTRPGRTFTWFPVVGLVIGAAVSAIAALSFWPADVTAFAALLVWVALTGGLHLDGLGDACDGLLATTTPQRRLEIMKDPRAGSWAVVGLALLLLGKWTALRHVEVVWLLLPPIAGRWAMVLAVAAFPYARESGSGAVFRDGFGRAQVIRATLTVGITGLFMALVWPGGWRALALLAAPVTVFFVGKWAAPRLGGGLTGDVYGAICELTELLCLLMITNA